jgi:hypothetical protein
MGTGTGAGGAGVRGLKVRKKEREWKGERRRERTKEGKEEKEGVENKVWIGEIERRNGKKEQKWRDYELFKNVKSLLDIIDHIVNTFSVYLL